MCRRDDFPPYGPDVPAELGPECAELRPDGDGFCIRVAGHPAPHVFARWSSDDLDAERDPVDTYRDRG